MGKKNYFSIYLVGALVVFFLLLIFYLLFYKIRENNVRVATEVVNKSDILNNIFDTEDEIPNSQVKIKYPSQGFYNSGVKISKELGSEASDLLGVAYIEPTAEFDSNLQSAYVVVSVTLIRNSKNFQDISAFSEYLKNDSDLTLYDKSYAKDNGHIIKSGVNEFFIFKVDEDATTWNAYALSAEGVVVIKMAYKNSFTSDSQNIYKNNDKLFLEILKNISLNQ